MCETRKALLISLPALEDSLPNTLLEMNASQSKFTICIWVFSSHGETSYLWVPGSRGMLLLQLQD